MLTAGEVNLVRAHQSQIFNKVNKRHLWRDSPVAWAQEKLKVFLWSKQIEILLAVAQHRRVAVRSCHEIGKSFIASVILSWWIDTSPEPPPGEAFGSFAVTSAPTGPQVRAILWREIGRLHARGHLPGEVNQQDWWMTMPAGNREVVALGRKPDEHNMAAFQGLHAGRAMYIFDEACGMPLTLFDAGDTLIANDASKAVLFGNPDDPTSHFERCCRPGSGWHVIEVGAFDSPNFTGEVVPDFLREVLIGPRYVEECRRKWAPQWRWTEDRRLVVPPEGGDPTDTNPLWQSKILGKFPKVGDEGNLIPIPWLEAAKARELKGSGRRRIGVDVGGGGDSSTGCLVNGPVARVLWEDHNPDTMHTCGVAVAAARDHDAEQVNVDEIGIGRGVVDRGKELKKAKEIKTKFVGINVGEQADDSERFVNRRAELWWNVRERFEQGQVDLDPLDDDTHAELLELRYKRTSGGKIQIESKDEAKRRGVPSPNRADSVMLAYAEEKWKPKSATWGR